MAIEQLGVNLIETSVVVKLQWFPTGGLEYL